MSDTICNSIVQRTVHGKKFHFITWTKENFTEHFYKKLMFECFELVVCLTIFSKTWTSEIYESEKFWIGWCCYVIKSLTPTDSCSFFFRTHFIKYLISNTVINKCTAVTALVTLLGERKKQCCQLYERFSRWHSGNSSILHFQYQNWDKLSVTFQIYNVPSQLCEWVTSDGATKFELNIWKLILELKDEETIIIQAIRVKNCWEKSRSRNWEDQEQKVKGLGKEGLCSQSAAIKFCSLC